MAKDIDGYSDPYCMLGIQPAEIASKPKPVHLDDGGVYCGDDGGVYCGDEPAGGSSEVVPPKITIASGSSISITIAGDSSMASSATAG